MKTIHPPLKVETLQPLDGSHTAITWPGNAWRVEGDNRRIAAAAMLDLDGFVLIASALGQCHRTTLLTRAQGDGVRIDAANAVVSLKPSIQPDDKAPYISDFEADIYLTGDIDESTRLAVEAAARTLWGARAVAAVPPD